MDCNLEPFTLALGFAFGLATGVDTLGVDPGMVFGVVVTTGTPCERSPIQYPYPHGPKAPKPSTLQSRRH